MDPAKPPVSSPPSAAAFAASVELWSWSLRLRLAHALVRLATVAAQKRTCSGFQHCVLSAGRLPTRWADQHHVRIVERRFEVDHAALRDVDTTPRLARFLVALQDVHALDNDLVLVRQGAKHLAVLALVLARDDDHRVARGEVEPAALWLLFVLKHLLKDLRGEADDLHEVALAELAGDRTEDASPAWIVGLCKQHGCVLVEADQRAVRPAVLLGDADHYSLHDLAFLDLAAGLRGLDGGGDDVTHRGVFPVVPARHADAQELFRTRVVRDLEACFL